MTNLVLKKQNEVSCFICLLYILEATWSAEYRPERLKVDNNYEEKTSLLRQEVIPLATAQKEARFSFKKIGRLMKGKLKWLLFKCWVSLQRCDSQNIKFSVRLEQEIKVP